MTTTKTRIVLVGAGHTHVHILHQWSTSPLPGAELICVSNYPVATYSGMLPGVLAGFYAPGEMAIDLVALCRRAAVDLVISDVSALDAHARELCLADGRRLTFDLLSIGVGSVMSDGNATFADDGRVIRPKPMQTMLARLDEHIDRAVSRRTAGPLRVVTVGGGAAAAELVLAIQKKLAAPAYRDVPQVWTVVSASDAFLADCLRATARRVRRVFARRGIRLLEGRSVTRVDGHRVTLNDRHELEADLIVWAAGAAPPPLLAQSGLARDGRGFLLTRKTLQTVDGSPVFAVGDSGTIDGAPMPKAGVYAVREGPVLWDNIRQMLNGGRLREYTPQPSFLKLLNTADGRAIGEWRGLSFEGAWCWRLKDRIDRRFITRFQVGGAAHR